MTPSITKLLTMYNLVYTIAVVRFLTDTFEFEWDKGNKDKNHVSHGVTDQECEEVFFDPDKRILKDRLHSSNEERSIVIGTTKEKRLLFVACTLRQHKIRIISARDLNRKERLLDEKKINPASI